MRTLILGFDTENYGRKAYKYDGKKKERDNCVDALKKITASTKKRPVEKRRESQTSPKKLPSPGPSLRKSNIEVL